MHHIKHRSIIAKQCRILCVLMTYLFAYEANANQTQSTDSIKATVKAAISRHLSEIYGKEKVEQDIDIKIGNLDSRLALPACSDELETELQQRQATSQNLSVRVKCSSGKRWSIYVPARLNIYEQVAVSVRNIRTGEAISSEDYVFKRSNIASLSSQYLAKNDDIADKIAKRPIRSGAILRSGDLKEPLLVKKGETLAVYARLAQPRLFHGNSGKLCYG